jgi:hypothetical protein
MCIHKLQYVHYPPHFTTIPSNISSYLRQCGHFLSNYFLFVEGDILDCIVEFPRDALLCV